VIGSSAVVYHSSIDVGQGKGDSVDLITFFKKLNKARKPAQLWGEKPSIVSELQALQLGNGGETV
jgi:hypothetical protein